MPGSTKGASSYRQPLCNSWRFNVEVNNLKGWTVVPDKCEDYVAAYMTGSAYADDSGAAIAEAISYAYSSANASALLAWVLDIDETSLSNLPYYAHHRFGAEAYNDTLFDEWVLKGEAPVLPATLSLFDTLKDLGYSVFFLTGRAEDQRNVTSANLLLAGYTGWDGLLLRGSEDVGVEAALYKSSKRKALEDLGYSIIGNVGDQWSDLTGFSVGSRVFKLPNPMYYIS
eukprot:c15416_g1_i1 orf=94-777(+)